MCDMVPGAGATCGVPTARAGTTCSMAPVSASLGSALYEPNWTVSYVEPVLDTLGLPLHTAGPIPARTDT